MASIASRSDIVPATADDWDISEVVSQLRILRKESLAARRRIGKPVMLPSRSALAGVVDGLSKVLFPNRLGPHLLASECVDYFVGNTLDVALRELSNQVLLELQFISGNEAASDVCLPARGRRLEGGPSSR